MKIERLYKKSTMNTHRFKMFNFDRASDTNFDFNSLILCFLLMILFFMWCDLTSVKKIINNNEENLRDYRKLKNKYEKLKNDKLKLYGTNSV